MKKKLYLIFIFFVIISCSNINSESRDYFNKRHENQNTGHGFIPNYSEAELKELKSEEVPLDLKAAKRGKVVFQKHCVECHGKEGRGNGPSAHKYFEKPVDLGILAKQVPNFRFFVSLSENGGSMPGWRKKFTREELDDLTHYLRTLVR